MLAERIVFLDGQPDMQSLDSVARAQTIKDMFECDLKDENEARNFYTKAANVAQSAGDLVTSGARGGDVVVGISASALTRYVRTALAWAKSEGCATVLICCNRIPRPRFADVLINPVTGPEVLTGSTRMKAGTATKMVLTMFSTAVMVGLRRVYDNLMVDVRPTSAKLRRRAIGLVEDIGGLGHLWDDIENRSMRDSILSMDQTQDLFGTHFVERVCTVERRFGRISFGHSSSFRPSNLQLKADSAASSRFAL